MRKADVNRAARIKAEELWATSGVRRRHFEERLTGPKAWEKELDRLAGRLGTGFIAALLGVRGCGKTQLAVELIRRDCAAGRPGRYTTAMDIFIDLRDAYKMQQSEREVMKRYKFLGVLVIDEAQERGGSGWEDQVLTALIDYRYSQMMDTVIISNQKRAEFITAIGASAVSRFTESGAIIECGWPSFRGKTKAP